MEFGPSWAEWTRWDLARVMCNLQRELHLSRTDQGRSKRSHSGYRLPCPRKEHWKTRKTRRLMLTESLAATRCSTLFISSYFTLSQFLEVGTIIIPLYKWRLREVTWALATQLVRTDLGLKPGSCALVTKFSLMYYISSWLWQKKKKGGGKTSGLAVWGTRGTLFPTKQLFKKILNIYYLKSLEVGPRAYRKWRNIH